MTKEKFIYFIPFIHVLWLSKTNFALDICFLVMQAWLFTLVILPAKSNIIMRLSLVLYLAILSILVQPEQVWKVSLALNLNELYASKSFLEILMENLPCLFYYKFDNVSEFPC